MLGDKEKIVCDQAIQMVLKIRKAVSLEENLKSPHVRQFVIPPINCKATTYYKMSTLSTTTRSESPAIRDKCTFAIKTLAENKLMHPCLN